MSKLTPLPYRKVIKKARKAGFVFRRRSTGTHEIWWNEEKKKTCVRGVIFTILSHTCGTFW